MDNNAPRESAERASICAVRCMRVAEVAEWDLAGLGKGFLFADGFEANKQLCAVVPGGRVELPTPAFSGPRSTGELPRHRWNRTIVRVRKARGKWHSHFWLCGFYQSPVGGGRTGGLQDHTARSGFATFGLAQRLIDFAQPVLGLQDFARLGSVGRAHDAVFFHDVDQAGGAAVADAQAALQSGSGSAAGFADHTDGFL